MKDIFNSIRGSLEQVQNQIITQLECPDEQIQNLISHITLENGKLLRPGLFLLSSRCFGQADQLNIKIAAILEMIHLATLLHDDVIDEATVRRNRQTVNNLYGNERAVLLGDYVLTRAFVLANDINREDVQKELANTAAQICIGELLQNLNRTNLQVNQQQYIDTIAKKTASLFACSCKLAGVVNGISQNQMKSLESFGLNLGIAFQIRDDILDIAGCEKKEGKTLGTDLKNSRCTLPIIHYRQNLREEKKIAHLSPEEIKNELTNTGSIEYSKKVLADYCGQAIDAISGIEDCPSRQAMINFAELIKSAG